MALAPRHARALREARDALADAEQAREDAIVAAWRSGSGSLREIGYEVGLSHVGVSKLLERLGVRARAEAGTQAGVDQLLREERGER